MLTAIFLLLPHVCRRSGRILSADFLADFVKSTCERACLTGVALAATTGEAQKPTRSSLPKICITFSFSFTLSLILTATLRCTRHVAKELATHLSANVQLQQRRDKEAPPFAPLFQHIAITTSLSVPKAPVAKLLATPPRPLFNMSRQISPPLEIVLANPPQRNSRSYENAPPR